MKTSVSQLANVILSHYSYVHMRAGVYTVFPETYVQYLTSP